MFTLYSFLLFLTLLLLSPYFVIQALRHGKYLSIFAERCGWLPRELRSSEPGAIWIHAVSVGEANAVAPLVEQLRSRIGGRKIFVSTTTLTGQQNARAKMTAADGFFYYPIDWRWSVRRALDVIRPSMVCLTETELWPNFIRESHRRGIRLALINGRISQKSFRTYRWVQFFLKKFLSGIDLCLMQTEEDAERIRSLGASPGRVRVYGSLKYDIPLGGESSTCLDEIRKGFLGSRADPVWVAGSTTEGEEEILLNAFEGVKTESPSLRLILAPRKPERFDAVVSLMEQRGLRFMRRTQLERTQPGECRVLLLDSMGELLDVYRLATVAFVGGSLVDRGGHNILEPASFGVPVLFGPYMSNFRKVAENFLAQHAALQVRDERELAATILSLLNDAPRARAMGERGRSLIAQSSGATARTVEKLLEWL